jgi:D-alanyl-D-alanine carboxypeptidase/D-alanyl-D-alanine-endopeptidase (penicillin-binding protein 4)
VRVRPGAAIGDAAIVTLDPPTSDLIVVNETVTAAPGTESSADVWRFPGQHTLRVRGAVAADASGSTLRAAVENPTVFFVRAFDAALEARGIAVDGDAVDGDDLSPDALSGSRRVLARHASPPLREIARPLMKVSQNLYAETVLRALSLAPGPASVAASRSAEQSVLQEWGVAAGDYRISDGSGLSRMNLLSASLIVRVLQQVAQDRTAFEAFEATLPIAGVDGSLASRFRGTVAEGNARAKTGTLTGARSLSGYVRSRDGERFVFSIVANHFTAGSAAVDAIADEAVTLVAGFSRRMGVASAR